MEESPIPMKQFLFVLALLMTAALVPAQTATVKPGQAEETYNKIHKIDVLIQILPLNLKKAQIDRVLSAMEKASAKEKAMRKMEDDELGKLDAKISEALKAGIEKGVYPKREFQVEVATATRAIGLRRALTINEMVDTFYDDIKSVLEPGQKTIMEKSLDVAQLDPSIKVTDMSSEEKIKFFIRRVLLDATAYDTLRQLQKFIVE